MCDGFAFLACLLIAAAGICAAGDLRELKGKDTYNEELLIKRLKSEHLLKQKYSGPDYALFPRIIGEVVTKHRVREFHLSLTQ
ncbi:unnamed protein product, partial [Gongylonema pulchrum]|uniref:Uncharacterized protein n=1 Tax=Gongylonema pulchrum TaxID=637853 RepID=A0A183DDD1_9BILA